MLTQWMQIALVGAIVTIAGPVPAVAQSSPAPGDTYTWHAELVSLDPSANTMTVKARVAYQEAVAELKHVKAGDRVWIVWSGIHDSSDAVRRIRRSATEPTNDEAMVLPAELVSTEAPNQYVTIRVKVPGSAVPAINTVKPGEWVTVTSRRRPSTDDTAVVAVKPYASSAATH